MEAQKRKLKHNWVPACQLLSSETGSYLVCKRCGYILRADGANKDKECKGVVKIGLRKGNQMNAKEAKLAAQKRATELKNQREAAERKQQQRAAKEWREERAAWFKHELEWIEHHIADAVSKGKTSISVWMATSEERVNADEKVFWERFAFKPELKKVIAHFEALGYDLKFGIKKEHHVDLSELPQDSYDTYETILEVSW